MTGSVDALIYSVLLRGFFAGIVYEENGEAADDIDGLPLLRSMP